MPLFTKSKVAYPTPPNQFTEAVPERGNGAVKFAYGVAGAAVGAAVVAVAKRDGDKEDQKS